MSGSVGASWESDVFHKVLSQNPTFVPQRVLSEKPSRLQSSQCSKNNTNCHSTHRGCCCRTCEECWGCYDAQTFSAPLLMKTRKSAAATVRRAGWDLLCIFLLLENSSHPYHKRHDFPAEQLMPTASGFTMDQGNFKFSLLFPICNVLCLSPQLRQTMTEVAAQNLGVGWISGKGDFPFSEHYHSP